MIKRGSRMFVQISAIGEVDDKGKVALSWGFKGKLIAEPDKPFACLVSPLVEEIARMARYSSRDALAADLKALRDHVAVLSERVPGPETETTEARP